LNLPTDSENTVIDPANKTVPFGDLPLSGQMQEALRKARYLDATPVQAGTIPLALEGVDVMAQARTGTGKTAAFAIPILERLAQGKRPTMPHALVLVPTRELAVQVRDEFNKLAPDRRNVCVALYGGKPIRGQIERLRRHPYVVVGTPGRVLDHIGRGSLQLKALSCVVLDEADRMLDIGFRPDIEKILRACPRQRQTLLLSATVPPPVERLAKRYMHDPEVLDFSSQEVAVSTIEQFYFTVDPDRKFGLLLRLLEREQPRQAIVFCRTKRGTERLYQRLKKKRSESVQCMHGDMQQGARDRVMSDFREGKITILVATDVVGRGIDVTAISHIVNYDTPQFCDDYVHRVGRTGRMGREGVAYTFVMPEEGSELTRIEMRINKLLKRDEIPGYASVAPTTGEPAAPVTENQSPAKPSGETAPPPEKKPSDRPPPPGRRGRRRHRRAL